MQCRSGPFSTGETGTGCAPYLVDHEGTVGLDRRMRCVVLRSGQCLPRWLPAKQLALPRGYHV